MLNFKGLGQMVKQKNIKRRALAFLLTLAVACPVFGSSIGTASADQTSYVDETHFSEQINNATVNTSNSPQIAFGGHVWYVVGRNINGSTSGVAPSAVSNTLTLFIKDGPIIQSDSNSANWLYAGNPVQFSTGTVNYAQSDIFKPLIESLVPAAGTNERNLIRARYLGDVDLADAYYWPLSNLEIEALDESIRNHGSQTYWSRTGGNEMVGGHYVPGFGLIGAVPRNVIYRWVGNAWLDKLLATPTMADGAMNLRPGTQVDISNLLFATNTDKPKPAVASANNVSLDTAWSAGSIYKLTVTTNALALDSAFSPNKGAVAGQTIEIQVLGATPGKQLAAVLLRGDSETPVYYWTLSTETEEDNFVSLTLPADYNLISDEIRVFVEERTDGNYTDFASEPQTIFFGDPISVTLNANEGSFDGFPSKNITVGVGGRYGAQVVNNPPTRTGYDFAGWWTAPTGGTQITKTTVVTEAHAGVTLYAHWTLAKYTIILDPNAAGDTVTLSPTTVEATYLQPYPILPVPVRIGFDFFGWRTAEGDDIEAGVTIVTKTSNHTLYAAWDAASLNVTFNANGGTPATQEKLQTYNAYYSFPTENPTKNGYTFMGWWTEPTGGVEILQGVTLVTNSQAHTLYAHWTVNHYDVTFAQGAGATLTGGVDSPKTVTFDAAYGTLPSAAKPGFTFEGWWTTPNGDSSGDKIETTTLVTRAQNHTLYAHWTANTYIVSFSANGGTLQGQSTKSVTFDAQYGELPQASRAGYNFAGWYTQEIGGELINSLSAVTTPANHTLYAHWSPISYVVDFDSNGGEDVLPPTKDVYFGDTYGTLPEPNRQGYTFSGWWTAATGGTQIFETTNVSVSQDHTLYAHWTQNTYVVTFGLNGGDSVSPTTKDVLYDSTYGTLPTPVRAYCTFDGWWTAATGGTQVSNTTQVTQATNHTLYAHWHGNQYTVTLNVNGGDPLSPSSVQVNYLGEYPALPTPTRTDYHFEGWWTAAADGAEITEGATVAIGGNHVLYARWVPNEPPDIVPTTYTALIGMPYEKTITATGVAPLAYSVVGAGLPSWLTLDSDGRLHGNVPAGLATATQYTFTVKVMSGTLSDTAEFTLVLRQPLTIATPASSNLPDGDVEIGTYQTIIFEAQKDAADGTVVWSIDEDDLPPGLHFSASSHALYGTITDAVGDGIYTFKVRAQGSWNTAERAFTIRVHKRVTITATTFYVAVGEPFSKNIEVDGTSPFVFEVTGDVPLPAWAFFQAETGTIIGTPTTTGTWSFDIHVSNYGGDDTKTIQLVVGEPPTITAPPAGPLNFGVVGYNYTNNGLAISASGPSGADITYRVEDASLLPPGISLTSAGTFTGVPTASGEYAFKVLAENRYGSSSRMYGITVYEKPTITNATVLTPAVAGEVYLGEQFKSSGSTPIEWSLSSGSLPPGLSLSTAGALTGTPDATLDGETTYTFTVKAHNTIIGSNYDTTRTFTLRVYHKPEISTSQTLKNAVAGSTYSQTLAAVGTVPITWEKIGGELPPGLSLSEDGSFAGTIASAAQLREYKFVAEAHNESGVFYDATREFSIFVYRKPLITTTNENFSFGVAGESYSPVQLHAQGSAPITYTVAGLPSGLYYDASEETIKGTVSATVAEREYAVTITAHNELIGTEYDDIQTYTISIYARPSIVETVLAKGVVGQYNSWTIRTNDSPYIALSIDGLPSEFSFNAATGVISGVPTAVGSYPVVITAHNSIIGSSYNDVWFVHLDIEKKPSITLAELPNAEVGALYGGKAEGVMLTWDGSPPITFEAIGLPTGLSINSKGEIFGRATVQGTYTVTISLENSVGKTSKTYTIKIYAKPVIRTETTLPDATTTLQYSVSLAAESHVDAPVTWALGPDSVLPPGLVLRDGVISGVPTAAGNYAFELRATNVVGYAQKNFRITILEFVPQYYTNKWINEGGYWYYYGSNSKVYTGWKYVKGPNGEAATWRYFDDETGAAGRGWVDITRNGKTDTYYFWSKGDGTYATGFTKGLTPRNGGEARMYLFDSSGKMQTGWKYTANAWRYFEDETGAAGKLWTSITRNGNTYLYYFWSKGDGTYAKNCTTPLAGPDGQTRFYIFDASGHCRGSL